MIVLFLLIKLQCTWKIQIEAAYDLQVLDEIDDMSDDELIEDVDSQALEIELLDSKDEHESPQPAVLETPINIGTKRRKSIETNLVAKKRYTEAEVFKDNGINNLCRACTFRKRERKKVGIVPVEFGCTKRNHHIVYGVLHFLQYSNES